MKDLNQQLLKFDLKQNYQNEDFYVNKSNFFAYSLIEKWPHWEKNILNIHGENHCGKTHLSNIFKKQNNAYGNSSIGNSQYDGKSDYFSFHKSLS